MFQKQVTRGNRCCVHKRYFKKSHWMSWLEMIFETTEADAIVAQKRNRRPDWFCVQEHTASWSQSQEWNAGLWLHFKAFSCCQRPPDQHFHLRSNPWCLMRCKAYEETQPSSLYRFDLYSLQSVISFTEEKKCDGLEKCRCTRYE